MGNREDDEHGKDAHQLTIVGLYVRIHRVDPKEEELSLWRLVPRRTLLIERSEEGVKTIGEFQPRQDPPSGQ